MTLLGAEPIELEPFFAAFALADPELTRRANAFLDSRVTPDAWVAGMFANLSVGEQFPAEAVEAYAQRLRQTPRIGAAVAQALQAQLDAAGGKPEGVYWLTKHLALDALSAWGRAEQRPLVEKFLTDTSSYDHLTTQVSRKTGRVMTKESRRTFFSELAAGALRQIDTRR